MPAPEERRSGGRTEEPRSQAGRSAPPALAPIIETQVGDEPEHRHFPRARIATRFDLWREEGGQRTFSATFISQNVSVSGAFLESTFFLPLGTEVQVRFSLEEGTEPVLARAEILREERSPSGGRSGFGIRFVEFTGQTEVSLARLFLGMRLRTFAEGYLQSRRARSLPNELERVVDVLAAWELLKATSPGDPWRGE
ncbi:MAG: PilZ domain-containing protein [Myxococcaceae bacterium]|nr:PilZ domain-containing protein [Myxococcaceae bacterium]